MTSPGDLLLLEEVAEIARVSTDTVFLGAGGKTSEPPRRRKGRSRARSPRREEASMTELKRNRAPRYSRASSIATRRCSAVSVGKS